ncbi:unnamed protein product, partial [Mesorhabditis spiculigera]
MAVAVSFETIPEPLLRHLESLMRAGGSDIISVTVRGTGTSTSRSNSVAPPSSRPRKNSSAGSRGPVLRKPNGKPCSETSVEPGFRGRSKGLKQSTGLKPYQVSSVLSLNGLASMSSRSPDCATEVMFPPAAKMSGHSLSNASTQLNILEESYRSPKLDSQKVGGDHLSYMSCPSMLFSPGDFSNLSDNEETDKRVRH